MAMRRVALAGCLQGEGPWIKATGDEATAHVGPLKDGETILMQVEGSSESLLCVKGENPICLVRDQKYRFVKTVDRAALTKTCVEVRFKCLEAAHS